MGIFDKGFDPMKEIQKASESVAKAAGDRRTLQARPPAASSRKPAQRRVTERKA